MVALSRTKVYSSLALLVLLCALGLRRLHPTWKEIRYFEQELRELPSKQEAAQAAALAQTVARLEAEQKQLEAAAAREGTPRNESPSRALSRLARAAGLSLEQIQTQASPRPVRRVPGVRQGPTLRATLRGEFAAVSRFVEAMAEAGLPLELRSLRLELVPESQVEGGSLRLSLELQA